MNKSQSNITKIPVGFFTARYETITATDEHKFYLGISNTLKKCVTNQGGSGTYKPFNPLYSTESDHHALIGFGTYNKELAHDPRIAIYYAYNYNEEHSDLADYFHEAIRKCFGMGDRAGYKGIHNNDIITNILYNGIDRNYTFTRTVILQQDEAEKLYSPYEVLRRGGDPGRQFTTCSIKGGSGYYGFVLYNEHGASYAYECNVCYKGFNPLTDIESCINAHFEDVADLTQSFF
ncbi:hypothetical protein Cyrtocomes_01198 [Candidatus Cyrtobacter comes]|uniref:Uncharacterized protein n=1 Tax=Candidatus Cyrtobacter comes TaxID=675776 RepID=A0ABU5L9K5_9RICK|nr:hypothetical protein [Candidatus Cyrtobacter comes]MDZ5762803.1 hypothetical protein [Candidatus Cyrtobacter comes]